jgi:hypothetical protein
MPVTSALRWPRTGRATWTTSSASSKIHGLPRVYSAGLHEYVRGEFDRLWELAQVKDRYDE